MTKNVLITPAAADIIRTPDGAPAEFRLVISADDDDVTLEETEPVAVTGDTDKFTVTPDGDTRILKKSIPSVPDTLYYLHPDGSITDDPSGSVTLIAKGVEGGSYRVQTGAFSDKYPVGGSGAEFGPVVFTTRIQTLCVDSVTGRLYAMGNFSTVGALPVLNAAVWDGESWSELGGGLGRSGYLAGMYSAPHPDGGFVVSCQDITHAGGVAVTSGVLRWTGSAWIDLEAPVNSGKVTVSSEGIVYLQDYMFEGGVWSKMYTGISGFYSAVPHGTALLGADERVVPYGSFSSIDAFPAHYTAEKIGPVFENPFPVYPLYSSPVEHMLEAADGRIYLTSSVSSGSTTHMLMYWTGAAWAAVPGFPAIRGSSHSIIEDKVTGKIFLYGQIYAYPGTSYPTGVVYGTGTSWSYVPFSSPTMQLTAGTHPGQIFYALSNGGGTPWMVFENTEPVT